MEAFIAALLALASFWLGACPFSLWAGRLFLGRDIRHYGDGNPGAANVFRAGGRGSFYVAVVMDVAKGVPFVLLARSSFGLPEPAVMAIGLSAILGHAFSPMLRFRGGKAIAVTCGVLLALPHRDLLVAFLAFTFLGFILMENDAWTVIFGSAISLLYAVVTATGLWQSLFMLCLLVVLAVKRFDELKSPPGWSLRPIGWLQSRRRRTT